MVTGYDSEYMGVAMNTWWVSHSISSETQIGHYPLDCCVTLHVHVYVYYFNAK